jgi:hypothetical protein
VIHRYCTISAQLGHAPKACTGLHDLHSAGHAPKACQATNPQIFTISTGLCPSHLHRPAQSPLACTPNACQARDPQAWHDLHQNHAPKAWQVVIHRHSWSPLLRPTPFRHARPTLQRPTRLPGLNDRPLPTGPWDPIHLPTTTGGLQTSLGDTDRSRC